MHCMERESYARLVHAIVTCKRCPRLLTHCQTIAQVKRRAFQDQAYWGKPVPGYGDLKARLLVLGLAPAAHGANRTGRMFTGDDSATWLLRAMHRFGFASQPTSVHRDDGLYLIDAYLTAAARCAPPDNRPTTGELEACRPFFLQEMSLLQNVQTVICLGQIAYDTFWKALSKTQARVGRRPKFGHGVECEVEWGDRRLLLIASYHPSRQNTQTGRLTEPMLDQVFARARAQITGA